MINLKIRINVDEQTFTLPVDTQFVRKPPIPPRPKQENRTHVHEPGQNIRIDQSEV